MAEPTKDFIDEQIEDIGQSLQEGEFLLKTGELDDARFIIDEAGDRINDIHTNIKVTGDQEVALRQLTSFQQHLEGQIG